MSKEKKKSSCLLVLVIGLVVVIVLGMILGGSSEEKPKEPTTVSTAEQIEEAAGKSEGESNESTQTEASSSAKATLEEIVLVEEQGIKITATSLENSLFGPSVKLTIENQSEQAVMVQSRNVSLNGYSVETMFSPDVAAGKKANEELTFSLSEAEQEAIGTIAEIECSLVVMDADSWDNLFQTDLLTLKTSAYEGFQVNEDNSGKSIYNDNGIEIVAKGLQDDSVFGPGVLFYLYNSTDKNICVQTREESINGVMVDPAFSVEVGAGKRALRSMTFFSSDLEENDIDNVEELEFSFAIFDFDTFDDIDNTEPIALSFKE